MSKASIFQSVLNRTPRTNHFDLSHDVKMSFKMGRIYPTCIMEALPGDRFKINVQNLLRFAPLVSPVMHRVNVTTDYYFVPNRILWPGWEKFITGDVTSQLPYVTISSSESSATKLGDYLGYPLSGGEPYDASAFPVAAYLKIFDEYYRDQNLDTEKFTPLSAGNNTSAYQSFLGGDPLRRSWMHDYFTSCLPWAQKGDDVLIPLAGFQDVGIEVNPQRAGVADIFRDRNTDEPILSQNLNTNTAGEIQGGAQRGYTDTRDNLIAKTSDLSAQAASINTLRSAFSLQRWLEKNARGGTRYIESMLVHFGVLSPDKRLQRPELIGRARQKMAISEVLTTATTDSTPVEGQTITTPTGNLAGHGISAGGGSFQNYKVEEHGWIIGVINVQPITAYYQGLHRSYARTDRYDYYWPAFANLGEQAVLNQEVYIQAADSNNDRLDTFGYIPRWSEYRYMNSRVAGEMKTSLDYWHMARRFSSTPGLNADFVQADPTDRIFAVRDGADHIYAHIYNGVGAVRKMPKFAVPSILPG